MKIMFEKRQLTDELTRLSLGLIRNQKQTNEAYKRISASYKSVHVNKSDKTTDLVSIETLKRDPVTFSTRI